MGILYLMLYEVGPRVVEYLQRAVEDLRHPKFFHTETNLQLGQARIHVDLCSQAPPFQPLFGLFCDE